MIYLDYNATSPIRPEVQAAITMFISEAFGNPSSLHSAGQSARGAMESVRFQILSALGDPRGKLVFTSGGTEADNLALRGILHAYRDKGNHLIVSSVEHSAVLRTAQALEQEGVEVTYLPVDEKGCVQPEAIAAALRPETVLVSVMHANNEVGTIQPIEAIAQQVHEAGALFHTDAVQSFGKLPIQVQDMGLDLVSISGHKLGGLKGAGALYLRQGIKLDPILFGGGHEQDLRSGTENVVGIVALGTAVNCALEELHEGEPEALAQKRDRLQEGLLNAIPETQVHGDQANRLCSTLGLSFLGCQGETLLMAFDLEGVAVSTGSACSSGNAEPSHVLSAMGLSAEHIAGSIRFSLGWGTTDEDIDKALEVIPQVVERVRQANAL